MDYRQQLLALTHDELRELTECEAQIEQGLHSFVEAGEALRTIKDKRLYKGSYSNFNDYCLDRWGFQQRQAHLLINAAETVHYIKSGSVDQSLPERESHVRPLYRLEPEQRVEAWDRAVDTAPNGEVTAGHVKRVADEMFPREIKPGPKPKAQLELNLPEPRQQVTEVQLGERMGEVLRPIFSRQDKMAVHHSSETPEHYTPQNIIDAVIECMGEIDLDPCSNSKDNPNVPAVNHYTKEDDGLDQEWFGRVYMNPPYGREISQWVEKLCEEHKAGRVTEAIALVPSRTDTQWWTRLRDYPVCFVIGRLQFLGMGGGDPAPFPSAVFYLGEHIDKFFYVFEQFGDIWQRLEPGMFGE
jgi:phage N-6-adenine-methyltransferase